MTLFLVGCVVYVVWGVFLTIHQRRTNKYVRDSWWMTSVWFLVAPGIQMLVLLFLAAAACFSQGGTPQ